MSKVSSPAKFGKQFMRPVLSGDAPEDRALWNLSLVLLEIAEKRQSSATKTESQNQSDVEGNVSRYTDQDNSVHRDCYRHYTL